MNHFSFLRLACFILLAACLSVRGESIRLSNSDGVGGYRGVEDTMIVSSMPEASFGGSPFIRVGAKEKGLIRFSTESLGPIPKDSKVALNLCLQKVEGDWKDAEIVIYQIAPGAAGWSAGKADGKPENGATSWNHLLYSEIKDVRTGAPLHTAMAGSAGFSVVDKDYLATPVARLKLQTGIKDARFTIPLCSAGDLSWIGGKGVNGGFLLVAEGLPSGTSARAVFFSSNQGQADLRPALVIQTPDKSESGADVTRAGSTINYELKEPGFVSLAIYNGQGQVVRELLHGAERAAGAHQETWDGTGEDGKALSAGKYAWKLLETQGLKAEYLMTLGLSVDFFKLWPGNHVGVTGVAVDESGVYLGSGCSEARGFVMKMKPDGERLWTVDQNWFEAWQGPHSLAVDGDHLFMMQENYDIVKMAANSGAKLAIWDLVFDKKNPKDRPASTRADGGWVNMKLGKAGQTAAVDLAAGSGTLVMSYENFNCLRWIDQANGKIIKETAIKEPLGVAVDNKGDVLVISEGTIRIFEANREPSSILIPASKLTSPWRVTVNRANGDIWVAERGPSHQVKRFSQAGELLQTFGVLGGRPAQGLYDGQAGFRNISSIAVAPDGSFWVTEAFSAPRRIAHFNADGKMLREWYGPQMYANRASVDPADPSLVWMDSMWGELIQAKVDYANKTWKVLATYSYMNPLQPRYQHERGMWFVCHANGRTYLAKESGPNVLMVDEPGRRLVPMYQAGDAFYPGGNPGWRIPEDLRPAEDPWPGQTSPNPKPAAPWSFIWTNTTGSVQPTRDEMVFGRELFLFPHHGFVRADLTYVTSLEVSWKESDNAWQRKGGASVFKPTGFTEIGVPKYDLTQAGNLPLQVPSYLGAIRCFWEDEEGNVFTAHNATKSRTGEDPFGVGKTANWLAGNYVAKWSPEGQLRWAVGRHAAGAKAAPGEVRMFYRMAGTVNGCIAVNDIDYGMVHVWDQDGLWVGRLMDNGLINEAIPEDAYTLCGENFGGYLFKNTQDGNVYFLGGSYNATPVYKITGWDKFQRQQGTVDLK